MTFMDLLAANLWLLITMAIVLGLLVGSFLNVVIYRLPLMMQREWRAQCLEFLEMKPGDITMQDPVADHKRFNLIKPDSHCPKCGAAVRAWQNIPVISYLFLKGRCAGCSTPISARYPVIETVSAIMAALVAFEFGASWSTLFLLIFSWSLLALTMIDYDHQLLPDDITLPLLWLGLLASVLGTGTGVTPGDAIIGAIVGYLALWSVYWAFKLLTGREGMGYGDFKLLAVLGVWLGWQQLLVIILLSSLVGAIVGTLLMVIQRRDRNVPIPFGPYLAGAGFITLIWGDSIIQAYFRLAGISP